MRHLGTTQFGRQPAAPDLEKPAGVVRLAHLSDFHFGKPSRDHLTSEDAVERWLADLGECDVDVLVVTGDLVETPGDRERLLRARSLLDGAGCPYVVVPGNHDVPEPGTPGPFEAIFGDYPRVERLAGVGFVLFDSMQGLPPAERSQVDREERIEHGAYSRGKVGAAQRRYLDEHLGDPPRFGRVMLVHHHLRRNAPTAQGREDDPTSPHGLMAPLDDRDALLDWAAARDVRLAFHGHKHHFWDAYEPRPGLVVINSGSSARAKPTRPRRARLVDVWPRGESIAIHDLEMGGGAFG